MNERGERGEGQCCRLHLGWGGAGRGVEGAHWGAEGAGLCCSPLLFTNADEATELTEGRMQLVAKPELESMSFYHGDRSKRSLIFSREPRSGEGRRELYKAL